MQRPIRLSRRRVLGATAPLALYALAPALSGCSSAVPPSAMWRNPGAEYQDARLRDLSFAVLAPNAHNTQPWKLDWSGADTLDLYVDPARLLPETDPVYRQTHVSQGTFLETARLAAFERGYDLRIEYFPNGEYSSDALEWRPVARLAWKARPRNSRSELFQYVPQRQSNKRVYERTRITSAQIERLTRAGSIHGCVTQIVSEEGPRNAVAEMAAEAMRIEMSGRQRVAETAKWFRFCDTELAHKLDGFSLGQSGKSGLTRFIAEAFVLDEKSAPNLGGAFAEGSVDLAVDQARSSSAFVVLSTPGNLRRQQLDAGRAYVQVTLTATRLGLSMHPMSQVIEEYTEMTELQEQFKKTLGIPRDHIVQMFTRLGVAEPVPHTPRRPCTALFV